MRLYIWVGGNEYLHACETCWLSEIKAPVSIRKNRMKSLLRIFTYIVLVVISKRDPPKKESEKW
jgi:hypothetical protein